MCERYGPMTAPRMRRRAGRWRRSLTAADERGTVTAEFALASVAAAVVAVMTAWAVVVLMLQLRCIDAASEIARQLARGDTAQATHAEARAPRGSRITSSKQGGVVVVVVKLRARPLAGMLPTVPLRAEARVVAEPA